MDWGQFSNRVHFFINGKKVELENPNPKISLLHFLRNSMHLTGAKQSCNEGGCGSCTVMVSKYNAISNTIRHFTVTSCLVSVCSLHLAAVTTIEGLGSTRTKLHPCQESIAAHHGTQCGFCTPGMIMSMYALLRNNPQPKESEMEAALRGNLCRCTGYRPILDSFRRFCKDCTCSNRKDDDQKSLIKDDDVKLIDVDFDSSQDVIFPPKLKVTSQLALGIYSDNIQWYTPISLEQLVYLRNKYTATDTTCKSMIVGGNTKIQHCQVQADHCDVLISVTNVPELSLIDVTTNGLVVGAAVTLSELETVLMSEIISTVPNDKTKFYKMLLEAISLIGSQQIRNQITLGGAVISRSTDIMPILICSQCTLKTASISGSRELTVSVSTPEPTLKHNEILVSICIPYSQTDEYIAFYKQSKRKYLDSAIANSCMYVKMEGTIVKDIRLVFGAENVEPIMASKTSKTVIQKEWNDSLILNIYRELLKEFGQDRTAFQQILYLSFFYKFFTYIKFELSPNLSEKDQTDISALQPLPFGPSRGCQGFQSVSTDQPLWDSIGRPTVHLSANKQTTGEARYVDDIPSFDGELFAGFVLSTCAHATFTLDISSIKDMKGIAGFVCAKDVPGSNITGVAQDEKLFVEDEVTAVGQIMGLVLAKDRLTAQRAAKAVRVEYRELPAVLTIDDAIERSQFFDPQRELKLGNVQEALAKATHVCHGEIRMGGQEHYYMETCSCICIPSGEHNEMEIISSTQNLASLQDFVSQALGIPKNRITAKVKRLGGGFGGKELRCNIPYTAVAVAAHKMQVPIRSVFERSEDMVNTGQREPIKAIYQVGFSEDGKLEAYSVDVYINAGFSADLSLAVAQVLGLQIQSAYKIPNIKLTVRAYKTNLPSNTAMRGFGIPQALMIMENVISHVADTLGVEANVIQERNLLRDGDTLLYGYKMEDCTIRRCWDTLKEKSEFDKKMAAVKEFNRLNKWKKRGISLVPTQQGIGIPEVLHFNHGSALVLVYTDGSVLLAHGGIEMGQGLHTKMVQVCSKCLSIPMNKIHLKETSSDKVPNAFATSASISSDLYGMAVKDACDQINERIKPIKEANPDSKWEEWVMKAYESRINLSVQGFYKTPELVMNWDTGIGKPFSYYTYGAGCSVVEVDVLTGQFKILSADLLMDVGNSLNPAIDIGQVEGAYTQGLGLFTMEDCVFSSDGKMISVGPGTYKIPGVSDIPIELNVTLLDRCPNPKAIFSSKAIGEPPLFLAASVFFAIKEAVRSARSDNGVVGHFEFWSPATAQRIRLACEDKIVQMTIEQK